MKATEQIIEFIRQRKESVIKEYEYYQSLETWTDALKIRAQVSLDLLNILTTIEHFIEEE